MVDPGERDRWYCDEIEAAVKIIESAIVKKHTKNINARWMSLRLLDGDESLIKGISEFVGSDVFDDELMAAVDKAKSFLKEHGLLGESLRESIVGSIIASAEEICRDAVVFEDKSYGKTDRVLDRLFTSKLFGYPIMLALLAVVFWITITGANGISAVLSSVLFKIEEYLATLFLYFDAPSWLCGVVVFGAYRVLAWVVSVMLPPMAIFFPLFTLLEDSGYLPRVAYNLDKPFCHCNACGKQALTMCMGFGCNAAGVVGCRIIDSPRERLLAMITNSFVPCNGKFPMLIALITAFFVSATGILGSAISAAILACVILLGIFLTFWVTKILSKTILRGIPSSFALELPPYRCPQIGRVIVRSVFDRTVFVLGRAAAVAVPAGVILWLMANVTVNDISLLSHCAEFLDPFARILGLDGVILVAFILGFPANEIVVPIMIMAYMAQGTIADVSGGAQLREIFVANGWTWITAGSVILFSLLHWPCSTTLMTVKKETGSIKWTILAALLPTAIGMIACFIFANTARIFV